MTEPAADDHIWRYMDLARFLELLESQALFFGSAAGMRDPWEGAFGPGSTVDPDYVEHLKVMRTREMTYLNCWSVGEVESAALWDLYQRDGKGVAVRSTWGRLTQSLHTNRYIVGGRVTYADHAQINIDPTNIFNSYVYKREQFEYEHETRLVYWAGGSRETERRLLAGEETTVNDGELIRPGFHIRADLDRLIERVYVAPGADPWVAKLIRDVITKYGRAFEVVESNLYIEPR